jgi:hypothetical protein
MEEEQAVSAEAAEEVQAETPAEEAAPAAEEQAQETGEQPEPKKKSFQERADELTRKRRDAERERDYWRQVALEKDQAIRQQTKPERPAEIPGMPPEPDQDQFDTTAAYVNAMILWHDNRKEIVTRAMRQQEEKQKALQTFFDRASEIRAEHEDFDTVVETPPLTDSMRSALMRSDNGPLVAYYLGNNHAESTRICNLPLELQLVELGKLEAKLMLAKQTKKVPSAPPPIKPVGMSGTGAEKDPGKMSIDEWMAWDRKRTMEKLKAKYGGT